MRIGLLTLDANVLIDLSKTDRTVLNLISEHIGQIYVPITIFEEVKQIDETECLGLGIILHEPEFIIYSQRQSPGGSYLSRIIYA